MATKFAVAAYSQQLRLELGPQGLHVLLVCPGPIRRNAPRLYPLEGSQHVPERARAPGAGLHVSAIRPEKLAAAVLRACLGTGRWHDPAAKAFVKRVLCDT